MADNPSSRLLDRVSASAAGLRLAAAHDVQRVEHIRNSNSLAHARPLLDATEDAAAQLLVESTDDAHWFHGLNMSDILSPGSRLPHREGAPRSVLQLLAYDVRRRVHDRMVSAIIWFNSQAPATRVRIVNAYRWAGRLLALAGVDLPGGTRHTGDGDLEDRIDSSTFNSTLDVLQNKEVFFGPASFHFKPANVAIVLNYEGLRPRGHTDAQYGSAPADVQRRGKAPARSPARLPAGSPAGYGAVPHAERALGRALSEYQEQAMGRLVSQSSDAVCWAYLSGVPHLTLYERAGALDGDVVRILEAVITKLSLVEQRPVSQPNSAAVSASQDAPASDPEVLICLYYPHRFCMWQVTSAGIASVDLDGVDVQTAARSARLLVCLTTHKDALAIARLVTDTALQSVLEGLLPASDVAPFVAGCLQSSPFGVPNLLILTEDCALNGFPVCVLKDTVTLSERFRLDAQTFLRSRYQYDLARARARAREQREQAGVPS